VQIKKQKLAHTSNNQRNVKNITKQSRMYHE